MNLTLNNHRLILIFLGSLCIALVPFMFFWYLAFVILFVKLFFIICIIDLIIKTSYRKSIGSVLMALLLACIVALTNYYLLLA